MMKKKICRERGRSPARTILRICVLLLAFAAACSAPEDFFIPPDSSSEASSLSSFSSSSAPFVGAEPGAQLVIACWNAEDFHSNKKTGAGTYAGAADFIEANSIDIIVITEIQPWDAIQLTAELAARGIHMTFRITSSHTSNPEADSTGEDEVAIFSRFVITAFEEVCGMPWFEGGSPPRQILRARVLVGDMPVWFYGMHLKANGWANTDEEREQDVGRREAQAKMLSEYIRANHDLIHEYIVVCGDINSMYDLDYAPGRTLDILSFKTDGNPATDFTTLNLKYLPLEEGGYTWKWYPNLSDPMSLYYYMYSPAILDHVIISPALYARYVPGSVRILLQNDTPPISDHFPIVFTITLE